MNCPHSKTCLDYPYLCAGCLMKQYPVNGHAVVSKGYRNIVKFKIFFDKYPKYQADELLNQWLTEHPSVRVVDYQYQAHQVGHSICITYKEETNA